MAVNGGAPGSDDESLLQFPCDFPIKIMGSGDFDLRLLAVELVRRHAPDLDETRIRVRDSRTGRYQSVTVVVRARAREQLDAIYRELSGHPRIALVL
jgi:putative lipoic acid-binding regulatory protein